MAERATVRLRRLLASRWLFPAAALALAALGLLELLVRSGMTDSGLAPIVVLLLCAPVAVARWRPLEAACAEGLVFLLGPSFEGGFPDSTLMAQVAVAYSCGAHASRRRCFCWRRRSRSASPTTCRSRSSSGRSRRCGWAARFSIATSW